MTEAILEQECKTGNCNIDMSKEEVNLQLFVDSIEADNELEIHASELTDDGDALIIVNNSLSDGQEGRFARVEMKEIFNQGKYNLHNPWPEQIISVIKAERNPIVLNGVTRIVGYYSRTHNWNKSKVGELRDRVAGRLSGAYTISGMSETKESNDSVKRVVDNLS